MLCFSEMMLKLFGYVLKNAITHVYLLMLDDVGLVLYMVLSEGICDYCVEWVLGCAEGFSKELGMVMNKYLL